MLVGAVIVQDQVQLQGFGKLLIQTAQELQELLVAMPGKALTDDFPLQNFQRGEKGGGAVADIIVTDLIGVIKIAKLSS